VTKAICFFFSAANHEPGQRQQRREEREAGAAAEPVPAGARGDGGGRARQRLVVAELVRVVGRRRQPGRAVTHGDRRVHAVPDVLHGGQEGLPHLHQLQAALPRGPPPRRQRRQRGRRGRTRRQEARQAQVKEGPKQRRSLTGRCQAGGAVDAQTDG
jgi:hypothetical protein